MPNFRLTGWRWKHITLVAGSHNFAAQYHGQGITTKLVTVGQCRLVQVGPTKWPDNMSLPAPKPQIGNSIECGKNYLLGCLTIA